MKGSVTNFQELWEGSKKIHQQPEGGLHFFCFAFYDGNGRNMFNLNTDEKRHTLHVHKGHERT